MPPAVGSVEDTVTKMNLKSIVARVPRRPTEDGVVSTKALGAIWGDGTPIHKVEVRVDDGDWRAAELAKASRQRAEEDVARAKRQSAEEAEARRPQRLQDGQWRDRG